MVVDDPARRIGGKKFAIGQQNIGGGRHVEQIRWIVRSERSEKVPVEFPKRSVQMPEEEQYMNAQGRNNYTRSQAELGPNMCLFVY